MDAVNTDLADELQDEADACAWGLVRHFYAGGHPEDRQAMQRTYQELCARAAARTRQPDGWPQTSA